MDLIAIGVKAEALPKSELVHVRFHIELEHTVIFAALVEPAAIGEGLAVIATAVGIVAVCKTPNRIGAINRSGNDFTSPCILGAGASAVA